MSRKRLIPSKLWVLLAVSVACAAWCGLMANAGRAAEHAGLGTSVQWIPQDASFYCAMLRNREQVEIIGESKAWAKLKAMPVIDQGLKQFEEEAESEGSPAAWIKSAQANPEILAAVETIADMLSEEIFVYGGADWVPALDLLQQIVSTVRYGSIVADVSGEPGEVPAGLALSLAAENVDSIKIPTTCIGFKVEDKERTTQQLEKVAGLLTVGTMLVPQLSGRFTRSTVGEDEFLTLSFDGEMIPWNEVPLDDLRELEANEGDADKVIEKLKELKLVVALGLRGDYLLIAFAESTDVIADLGEGEQLIDRPEFKPLEKFADKRICGISYISESMYSQLASNEREIDNLVELLETALPHAGLPQEDQSQIMDDAMALASDLKALLPEPGAVMGFSFLTDQGVEGYSYNWGEQVWLDGSKPLGLLGHIGGNPLLAVVWREVNRPEDYDLVAKWLNVGYGYFEKYALPEMSRDDREQFEEFRNAAAPLVDRADEVTREMLLPALADRQGGLVIDGKLMVRRLCREVPPLDQPMPMAEPALVIGVSDADLFLQALSEYRDIFNGLADALHQVQPDDVPDFEIPEPKTKKTTHGELFMYPLPKEWGMDKKIVPNLGLSEHVAVITVSRQHTQRLLEETAIEAAGVLSDTQRPRAVGVVFDWAGLVDAATPWVDFAATKIIEDQMGPEADDSQAAAIKEQVHTVLDVLKVIRTCTIESYMEDGAMVSHSLMEIRDIE